MATNHGIINELSRSYAIEPETVQNYLANSIDLDGVCAEEIKKTLLGEIEDELGHARKLGNRIKVLEGRVPGFARSAPPHSVICTAQRQHRRDRCDPRRDSCRKRSDRSVQEILKMCDPINLVTQDLILEIAAPEQAHRRQFIGVPLRVRTQRSKTTNRRRSVTVISVDSLGANQERYFVRDSTRSAT